VYPGAHAVAPCRRQHPPLMLPDAPPCAGRATYTLLLRRAGFTRAPCHALTRMHATLALLRCADTQA
jgi:hypothetical protein